MSGDSNADESAPVRPGDLLAGRYRVEQVLGVGGMGVVVAAQHVHLGQRVALKFLLPAYLGVPEAAGRFAREARNAVRIQNEHVARVSDVGTLESGAPYMVMEYLQGSDLSQLVRRQGPVPVADAVDYVLQACVAIAEAHALGIVHRDLKPANLFLADQSDGTRTVKVLDFGISKATVGQQEAALTKTSAMMGSPLYMAPEQMTAAKTAGTSADIWALGVIVYELIVGHVPFLGETMPQICAAVLSEDPPPISSARPDVPPGLDAVIQRCLSKNPSARYADVVELASALLPFAHKSSRAYVERASRLFVAHGVRSSIVDIPVPPSTVAPAATAPAAPAVTDATVGSWSETHAPKRSGSRVWLAALAVGAVVVVGGGWFLMRSAAAQKSASASAPASATTAEAPKASSTTPQPAVVPAVTPSAEPSASVAPAASSAQPAPPPKSAPAHHYAWNPAARPKAPAPSKPAPRRAAPAPAPTHAAPPRQPDNPLNIQIK